MAKVMLLTQADRKRLPPLYSQEQLDDQAVAQVKLFHAYGAGTWYATEFDGEDTFFGWCESPLGSDCDELGYFSLAELTELRARVGGATMPFQAIERDRYFEPCKLAEIPSYARSRGLPVGT